MATTEAGASLVVRPAGGPWGRARGLLGSPGLCHHDDEPPTALWLGRTPQVHTVGMKRPIAVVTAVATRPGSCRGRPTALRVIGIEMLEPGRLGRWSWAAPITLELEPDAARRLGLADGSFLSLTWTDRTTAVPA